MCLNISIIDSEVVIRQERAKEMDLQARARLEDITVRRNPITKQTKKGERTYYKWVAIWREGEKVRKAYVGSCRKMGWIEALQKAKSMKAKAGRALN